MNHGSITFSEKEIEEYCASLLKSVTVTIDKIKSAGLENRQWVLNWVDELNRLSVEV